MSCYHPLKGFKIGYTKNNKPNYMIVSYKVPYVWKRIGTDEWYLGSGSIPTNINYQVVSDFVEIPCGKCIGCRLKYSRDWADRCSIEAKEYAENYFVTLTYDEEHVPLSDYFDNETGEQFHMNTLCKRDFQLFMKRLRKRGNDGIRFFACGEYGSTTMRPHYHAILFNLHLDDLEKLYEKDNMIYYRSAFLESVWKKGFVIVTNMTWETCAYVARYVCKKSKNDESERYLNKFYEDHNIEKEFILMSRKPGIGRKFYDDNKDEIYEYDEIHVSTRGGSVKRRPPRYFDKLFEEEFPEHFEMIKGQRQLNAELLRELKLKATSQDYENMLLSEEENQKSRMKKLSRNKI